jgi:hypothetical protein
LERFALQPISIKWPKTVAFDLSERKTVFFPIYADLLQLDIDESYRNLSYKTLSAYQWLHLKAKSPEWIIKTDDDIAVDWHDLVLKLDSQETNTATDNLYCHFILENRFPDRNPASKL